MGFILTRACRVVVVICVVVTCTMARDAMAQSPSELERGRNLFRQALSMEVAGDWAGALSRLESVSRIRTTPQVRFHLARCKEHLGRLTEALGDYRLAEYEATKLNAAEVGEISRARLNLEMRVPKLIVTLSSELVSSTVELDGIALGVSRLGKEIPVDPGEHQLVVRTADGQSFVRRTHVTETAIEHIQIEAPPGFVPQSYSMKGTSGADKAKTDNPAVSSHTPAWAWVSGGVGAAAIISAGVFWYVREKAIDDLNNGCDSNNICPTSLKPTQSRGEFASVAAPVALGVGIVGLGIAAYGFLAPAPKRPENDAGSVTRVRLNLGYDAHFAGVNVSGAF